MSVLTIVVGALAALLFFAAAASKLRAGEDSEGMRAHLGVPDKVWKVIAPLEIAGGIGLLIGLAVQPLGLAAAGGLTLLSVGAAASHLRVGDGVKGAAPALAGLVLAVGAGALLLT
ncbi:DoxX family protein [Nocardioides sp. NPDC127514]|uniref:DoxX family protein n=1 Tax=unclassified Nocardioides TaxID=2615069 RepID=UPI00331767B4